MSDKETTISFGLDCLAAGASAEQVLRVVFAAGEYHGLHGAAEALSEIVRRHEVKEDTEAGTGAP